jgi:thioredoxin-like negative regulator of GroEL
MMILALLVLATATAACAASVVLIESDAAFAQFLARGARSKTTMLAATSDTCGHCRRMKPTWEEYAASLSGDDESAVAVVRVDCPAARETCAQLNVRGYPTIMAVRDGLYVYPYRNARTVDAFRDFATLVAAPGSTLEFSAMPPPLLAAAARVTAEDNAAARDAAAVAADATAESVPAAAPNAEL